MSCPLLESSFNGMLGIGKFCLANAHEYQELSVAEAKGLSYDGFRGVTGLASFANL